MHSSTLTCSRWQTHAPAIEISYKCKITKTCSSLHETPVELLWSSRRGLFLMWGPCPSVFFWSLLDCIWNEILHLTIQELPNVCCFWERHKEVKSLIDVAATANFSVTIFGSIGTRFWNSDENKCSVYDAAGPFVFSSLIYCLFFIRWRPKKCSCCFCSTLSGFKCTGRTGGGECSECLFP